MCSEPWRVKEKKLSALLLWIVHTNNRHTWHWTDIRTYTHSVFPHTHNLRSALSPLLLALTHRHLYIQKGHLFFQHFLIFHQRERVARCDYSKSSIYQQARLVDYSWYEIFIYNWWYCLTVIDNSVVQEYDFELRRHHCPCMNVPGSVGTAISTQADCKCFYLILHSSVNMTIFSMESIGGEY